MSICPICNGLQEIHAVCPSCGKIVHDAGRIMDYYDDYSAYMPIDQLKLEDGYPDDLINQKCPHLFYCISCGHDQVIMVKQWVKGASHQ